MKNYTVYFPLVVFLLFSGSAFAQRPANPGSAAPPAQSEAVKPKFDFDDPKLTPRELYNAGITMLRAKDFDNAVTGFLKARDNAVSDNELRFRAAYNLALAYAHRADSLGDPDNIDEATLERMIDDLKAASAWFRDAVQQNRNDEDAVKNLDLILKRTAAVNDIRNKRYNTIEHQLDTLIEGQRGVLNQNRSLGADIDGEKADPLRYENAFKSLASSQRSLITDANLSAENIADSIAQLQKSVDALQKLGKDDPNAQQQAQELQKDAVRHYQLNALLPVFDEARRHMNVARRNLRDLEVDATLKALNKAFLQLKQAREMLEDPMRLLNALIADENEAARVTVELTTDGKKPRWLNKDLAVEVQNDVLTRGRRLDRFFKGVVAQAEQGDKNQIDPNIAKMKEADVFVEKALQYMDDAQKDLEEEKYAEAFENEIKAVKNLEQAAEIFADLKHLIEMSHDNQEAIGAFIDYLLHDVREPVAEVLPQQERNRGRIQRMAKLIVEERQKALTPQQENQQISEDMKKQIEELYDLAEKLRKDIDADMQNMIEKLAESAPDENAESNADTAESGDEKGKAFLSQSKQIEEKIDNLRFLFFTLIEHLKDLGRKQVKTMDQTARLNGKSVADEKTGEDLQGVVADAQNRHAALAGKLSEELEKQGDKMSGQNPSLPGAGDQEQLKEMAQKYKDAAGEMKSAAADMRRALSHIEGDFDGEKAQNAQNSAVEHIAKAIALLQPPQNQQNQEQQQNQDQQNQDQQNQEQQQQKMSKAQAEKKLRQIQDREAKRRMEKAKKQKSSDIVDQDW